MTNDLDQINISISKIKLSHWIVFITYCILSGVLLWQFFLPFLAERHFRDGYHYEVRNSLKYAIEELSMAVKLAPWETHYQTQLGKLYEMHADQVKKNASYRIRVYQAGLKIYIDAMAIDDRNPWYMNRYASICLKLSDVVTDKNEKAKYKAIAEKYKKMACDSDPQNPLFQLNYAYYLHKEGHIDEAIEYYKKTVEMDGSMKEARFNLGSLYKDKNKLDEALDQFLAIYEKDPTFNQVSQAIYSLYILKNDHKLSIPYLEKMIEINPNSELGLKNLGSLYYKYKEFKKAAAIYEILIGKSEDYKKSFFSYYVQSLVLSGQISKAKRSLMIQLKENPQDKVARGQLNKLNQAIEKAKNKKQP